MELERHIYEAFEAVVGSRNITNDLAIRETYRCIAAQSSAHYGPFDHRTPMPMAVICPGSTKEVQGVVRLCNKYGIQYKASTTFWSAHGFITSDYAVQIDMRRMNGCTIDAKNMIAICDPYCIAATCEAEAMKYGLTCNIPGVGCSSSMVANFAGWGGPGPSTPYTGSASENQLCAEWVLPDGQILTSASAGAGAGWFTADGPGPSQRGFFRGGRGLCGEMGICTKISVKLSPWPGPTYMPTSGKAPAYLAELPSNFRGYALCFPDWENWAQAMMALGDADIVYAAHRQFSMFGRDIKAAMLRIITDPDKQLCDIPALNATKEIQEETESLKREIYVVTAGMTPEDAAWKEAAINEILEKYHGWKDKMCSEPDMEKWLMAYFIRLGHKNLNYVLCGSYEGSFGLDGGNLIKSARRCEEVFSLKKEWEQKTTFMAAAGGDCSMGGLSSLGGAGGPMLWENFMSFDAHDKESIQGCYNFIENVSSKWQAENKMGGEFCRNCAAERKADGYGFSQDEHNAMFSHAPQPTFFMYQYKIREAFNPNHEKVSGSYYQTLDPEYYDNMNK